MSRIVQMGGLLVLVLFISTINAYAPDYPGPYCAQRRYDPCCRLRQDSCAVPISTTLCYCDEFCDRATNSDCCPDYRKVCHGEADPTTTPAPVPVVERCHYKGKFFTQFDGPIKDNCNLCKCHPGRKTVCEKSVCLVDEDILYNINSISDSVGWTARNYSEFWGRKYNEGLELRLGTKEPTVKVKAMRRLPPKSGQIPRSFNAVEKWSGIVTGIQDQGWCGSSWAVSTTSVASDRFGIQSNGSESVSLAPQQLLSCVRKQQGCNGGHLDVAWNYFRKYGLVSEQCYPYIAGQNKCKVHSRSDNLNAIGCTERRNVPRTGLYKTGPAYSLNNETDIMMEIKNFGPVQATIRVYRDFFSYSGGVYRHTSAGGSEESGFHSVKLVGWGEETGYSRKKYWIAANSWGTWWGENGYFRILRGVNECEIENYVLASWAHVFIKDRRAARMNRI